MDLKKLITDPTETISSINIKNINVPLVMVLFLITFTISGVFTFEWRIKEAAAAEVVDIKSDMKKMQNDMQQFQYQQAIKDDRQWIELLEQKVDKADSAEDKDRIKRQIKRTEKSLYINLEKIE